MSGAAVWCERSDNPTRKTLYDLIAVQKGHRLINMDSQAPNKAVYEWLSGGGLGAIENLRSETTYGTSRFDFSFEKGGKRCFLEVKGVTLENDGICAFPDAPTERGVKHIRELIQCREDGFEAVILFVIQMKEIHQFRPHDAMHPAFGEALREAAAKGVKIMAMDCRVTPESMEIDAPVTVVL